MTIYFTCTVAFCQPNFTHKSELNWIHSLLHMTYFRQNYSSPVYRTIRPTAG